jgi:hypothetical protein
MKRQVEIKRYNVQAKRKDTDEPWTDWTSVNDYQDALKHARYAKKVGYLSRIIDREETDNG